MNPESTTVACAIAKFLRDRGSDSAFVVAGGASLHLIHAFASTPGCRYLPVHHEQSAAMAADGFSRSCGRLGVAIATSGPGATNLITGIAGCHYDSIPAIFLTGQVSTTRMVGLTGVRQIGFQETPIVDMVRPITKGAFAVREKGDLRRIMEEALWVATEGRPGPVVIDVPDDIQRQEIIWEDLQPFVPPTRPVPDLTARLAELQKALARAQRPVVVAGGGVLLAGAEMDFVAFAEKWGAPVVLTWAVPHLLPKGHPQRVGVFGTHGNRHANMVIQNADLVLSIGSRLDTKATGSPISTFARDAVKIMVDIDPAELGKFEHFGMRLDLPIESDARAFLEQAASLAFPSVTNEWLDYCRTAETLCEPFDNAMRVGPGIDPYDFTRHLGQSAPDQLDVFVDTGCALPWIMTGFVPSSGQRIMHDLNNTAMGWSLPATIGGTVASPDRQNLCVIGDGSLMMSMHDLVTLASINPRARVVLVDNSGYSMIRQTQDQWLDSNYHSSSQEGGLDFPEYSSLATATGFRFLNLDADSDMGAVLESFWASDLPAFLRVEINPARRVVPQVRFGRPNEDMEPLLPRDVFASMMIVEALPQSLTADE
jgi:acetolactate synthase-1/2/3 large subunit